MTITQTFTYFNPQTRDVDVYVGGQFVGSRKHRPEAEDLKRTEQRKLDRQIERMKAVRN